MAAHIQAYLKLPNMIECLCYSQHTAIFPCHFRQSNYYTDRLPTKLLHASVQHGLTNDQINKLRSTGEITDVEHNNDKS